MLQMIQTASWANDEDEGLGSPLEQPPHLSIDGPSSALHEEWIAPDQQPRLNGGADERDAESEASAVDPKEHNVMQGLGVRSSGGSSLAAGDSVLEQPRRATVPLQLMQQGGPGGGKQSKGEPTNGPRASTSAAVDLSAAPSLLKRLVDVSSLDGTSASSTSGIFPPFLQSDGGCGNATQFAIASAALQRLQEQAASSAAAAPQRRGRGAASEPVTRRTTRVAATSASGTAACCPIGSLDHSIAGGSNSEVNAAVMTALALASDAEAKLKLSPRAPRGTLPDGMKGAELNPVDDFRPKSHKKERAQPTQ